MPLAPAFWSRFEQLENQLSGSENDRLSLTEVVKRRQRTWELSRPVVSIFQFDLLHQQIGLRSYVPPKAKRKGGRPRESRWYDWTAHLVDQLLGMQIPIPAPEEIADKRKLEEFFVEAANAIIEEIDAKLEFDDGVKLELRYTQPTVIRVLRHQVSKRYIPIP